VNAYSAHGIHLLYFPIIHSRKNVAEYLLYRGAIPGAASPGDITSFHDSVMFNQPVMALWLLQLGVNSNYDCKAPLALVLENEQTDFVEILREHGGKSE
jgi:hypothetical protein